MIVVVMWFESKIKWSWRDKLSISIYVDKHVAEVTLLLVQRLYSTYVYSYTQ